MIDSEPMDGIILRSYIVDGEETLFHFRYTSGHVRLRRSTRQSKRPGKAAPTQRSRSLFATIKRREWRDLVMYGGAEVPLELVFDVYSELETDLEWTEPQRRIQLPESCCKKFQDAARKHTS